MVVVVKTADSLGSQAAANAEDTPLPVDFDSLAATAAYKMDFAMHFRDSQDFEETVEKK